jgi:adenylate cyclase
MAKLYIFTKRGRSEYNLADHNVIGRHPKNRIKLIEPGVSKVHCLISAEEPGIFSIRDLGSRNGTFLNGQRIKEKMTLADGDEIQMGSTRCLFKDQADSQTIKWLDESLAHVQSRVVLKVAPQKLDNFFPENNIIDEEMLRADYERLRISFELQRDIGFDLHVDFILGRVLDRAHEFLSFDQGVVLLRNEAGEFDLHAFKKKNLEDDLVLSRALIEMVADEGTGALLANPNYDAGRESPGFIDTPVHATLAVPIQDDQELMGIVIIDRLATYNPYAEKDLNLLSNAANKASLFIRNSQIAKRVTRESLERERFRTIVSPDLAELVVAGQLPAPREGTRVKGTVLVANLIGFELLARALAPEAVVEMLNRFFEPLVTSVFRREGMVDKYLGDRLVAVWGVPLSHDDDRQRAVNAAVEMQRALEEINQKRTATDQPALALGIGLATGDLVAGIIGGHRTQRYTVVGQVVGVAEAVCADARSGQILADEETAKALKGYFGTEESHSIRQREGTIRCFEIFTEGEARPERPWTYLG